MRFDSFDGVSLSVQDIGSGRPVVLVHGFLSTGALNWIEYGVVKGLTQAGLRAILPDLRGHGASDAPHEAAAYPPDVLARDVLALVNHLELTDFDLVGYSLGARTALRALMLGLKPRRLVLGGMGAEGIMNAHHRIHWFIKAIENRAHAKPGSPEARVARFLAATKTDPEAAILILKSHVDTSREVLAKIATPTLVLCGQADHDNGSAQELAALIPTAHYQEIPGDHMSAITKPAFAEAIVGFLS